MFLGVQGTLLRTPETVPFRMTRNVVDGFGAAGTGGTLTQCAEITLRVLRENREPFMQVRLWIPSPQGRV